MTSSAPVARVLEALKSRGCPPQRSAAGWKARCPAHDDRRPSLSIGEGRDGAALLRCFAGCEAGAIIGKLGLMLRDLMPDDLARNGRPAPERHDVPTFASADDAIADLARRHGAATARWDYRNGSGEPVGVVVRWDGVDGKRILPVSLIGGRWSNRAMPAPRPLYNLPALLAAHPAERIIVVEGEKCADAARSIELVATTSAGGAQAARLTDWRPLAGRDVAILPDADKAGDDYARDVAAALLALDPPARVRVARLPDLPDGGDIADWLNYRDSTEPDELRRMIGLRIEGAPYVEAPATPTPPAATAAAGRSLRLRRADEVELRAQDWLWRDRLPLGALTLIGGPASKGKSTVALTFAATVTTGRSWPLGTDDQPQQPGRVLACVCEDGAAVAVKRFRAAGGDASRLVLIEGALGPDGVLATFVAPADARLVGETVRAMGDVRLVLLDPVGLCLGVRDLNDYARTYPALSALSELAQELGVAIMGVHHAGKAEKLTALDRLLGSVALGAAARSAFVIQSDPDDESDATRLLTHAKSSFSAPAATLAYRIERDHEFDVGRVVWLGLRRESADALNRKALAGRGRGPEPKATAEAVAFLRQTLASGSRTVNDVIEEGTMGEGLSKRSLERARKDAGVEAYRPDPRGPWFMRLQRPPVDDAAPDRQAPSP